MNWGPRSEVISPDMPNLAIHSRKSALAHVGAVESVMGIASVQRVNLSMIVKR